MGGSLQDFYRMLTFTSPAAKLKGWVQYCGFEGQWRDDQHFECTNGAKLVWSLKTGEIEYEGAAKAVKE